MRRVILGVLGFIFVVLVALRALFPAPSAMAAARSKGAYHMLEPDMPVAAQTAGSALIAELNSYYLACQPTAKNEYTGLLSGKNLVLILAENWRPPADRSDMPSLRRLRSEGADISGVYAPDWYQGLDGREFALLSGIMPTAVEGETAFAWAGKQGTWLPFALARCLADRGYACLAAVPEAGRKDGYTALGFSQVEAAGTSDLDRMSLVLPDGPQKEPFFIYCLWTEDTGERALTWLLWALEDRDMAQDTAVCLWTGGTGTLEGELYLWGPGLEGIRAEGPCSELDVTPTLLNLFDGGYDARFLSGRDIFDLSGRTRTVSAAMPPVSLYGSAYADWVTPAGRYIAAEDRFEPAAEDFSTGQETQRYIRQARQQVYDRYMFARRAMESNYFQIVFGP